MGKRKTARKPQKRVKQILAKKFLCIYCSHDDTVVVKLDMSNKIGTLVCGSCHVSYQTQIHSLAEPVDVYSAWIDSAE
ncbi:transcription elongation factor 1, partial [Powellomyces hirtus]